MPQTANRGYEFEQPSDPEPGRTLTGGAAGTSPILAEQVDADVNNIVAVMIGDLNDRLTVVEAAVAATRWREIASDTAGAGGFTVAVPAGYERLRLTLVGDLTGQGQVNLRINGDTGANYVRGFLAWDAAGAQDFPEYNGATTAVKVAEWSSVESNKVVVDIEPTDGSMNPSFRAYSTQVATGGDTTHRAEFGWGKYLGDVVVSSVTVVAGTTDFATVRWWLEGYLA
jgi:hypothetical protein